MSKLVINLSPEVSESATESTSRGKGGKAKSPRQEFFSALMKRLSGDSGNEVAAAFQSDRKKFKGMMMSIVSEMAKVDGDDE